MNISAASPCGKGNSQAYRISHIAPQTYPSILQRHPEVQGDLDCAFDHNYGATPHY